MSDLAASFIAALLIAAMFPVGGRLSSSAAVERFWSRRRWISAAAGISVAYIFVDVLPELELQRRSLVEASAIVFFAEQRVYVLALVSFVFFYGIEHIVLISRDHRRQLKALGKTSAIYLLQLSGYIGYGALIGYLLVERTERGMLSLALYAFAMAVHFLIVDHSLDEEHGDTYGRRGRIGLTSSIILGWGIGAALPLSEAVVARLFALLAGGVVITSLRAELPDEREGRFWPFSAGALCFALILLLA